jgi:hypothetical protein
VTTTVIDLGLVLPADPAETPDAPEAGVRGPSRGGRIGLLLAALVLFVTASGPTTIPSGLTVAVRIPAGTGVRLLVLGTTALVTDRLGTRDELSAYAIGSGRRLWRSTLDGELVGTEMFVSGSTIVVETDRNGGDGDHVEGFTVSTGVRRWIRTGTSVSAVGTGLLVYQQRDDGDTGLTLVDALSGRPRWQASLADDCDTYLASDPSRILASGLLAVCGISKTIIAVDLATGRVRAQVRSSLFPVPRTRRSATGPILRGAPRLAVIYLGDVVVVTVPSRFAARTLSAFRTSDLDLLWSGVLVDAQTDVAGCGPDLCVGAGLSATAVDLQTGRLVPRPGDSRAEGPESAIELVPQGTSVPTPPAPDGVVALAAPTAGSTWVEVRRDNRYAPVQLLRGVGPGSCSVVSGFVACAGRSDQITLWRVN